MLGFRFYRCKVCEFVFTPDFGEHESSAMYQRLMEDAPHGGWANADFLEPSLERLGPGPLDILDFGSGESALPDELRARGHRVIAVDTAPPRQPHPDRLTGNLFDLSLPDDSFDLTFAFQVFEHLPRPLPYLTELLRVTRPGGRVVLHTDMHLAEREEVGFTDWWYVMPPVHCSFYRHRTFERMLESTPHRIVERAPKYVAIEKRGKE